MAGGEYIDVTRRSRRVVDNAPAPRMVAVHIVGEERR